jgi:acetylornithine deacetylase/succinyl-diaminopimelate desuccinylase-like protein
MIIYKEEKMLDDRFFSVQHKQMMLDLFRIYSPSKFEIGTVNFIKNRLTELNIPFEMDKNNNIFNLTHANRPMLNSHMDQVSSDPAGKYLIKYTDIIPHGKDLILKSLCNLGCDDRAGCFLILILLEKYPDLNFIFTVEEEIGGVNGIKAVDFEAYKEIVNSIPYGLTLDRRNFGDIICKNNDYGTKEFDEWLETIGKDFDYKSTHGSVSDANTISNFMSCANLSVSYFNPHSKTEFLSLSGLKNTYDYIIRILETPHERFEIPKKYPTNYGGTNYNTGFGNAINYHKETYNHDYSSIYCDECKKWVKSTQFNYTVHKCIDCAKKKEEALSPTTRIENGMIECPSCREKVPVIEFSTVYGMCKGCVKMIYLGDY